MNVQVQSRQLREGQPISFTLSKPDLCPLCQYGIEPRIGEAVHTSSIYTDGVTPAGRTEPSRISLVCQCPRDECAGLYISYYRRSGAASFNDPKGWVISQYAPDNFATRSFSVSISNTSNSFVSIYNQALQAESLNLEQIAGPGFRKALEFLIKDYLCSLPENALRADEIKSKFLGRCIKDDVVSQNIKGTAERAVWLGNDETHYVRKWEAHDISHLKKVIELTVYWISSEVETRELMEEMVNPR